MGRISLLILMLYSTLSNGQKRMGEQFVVHSTYSLRNELTLPQVELTNLLISADRNVIRDLSNQNKIKVQRVLGNDRWVVKMLNPLSVEDVSTINEIDAVNNLWKLSNHLFEEFKAEKINSGNYLIVGLSKSELSDFFNENSSKFSIVSHYQKTLTSQVRLVKPNIELVRDLLSLGNLRYVDVQKEKLRTESVLNFHDLSLNKVNKVHNKYPSVNGSGITISVKEDHFDVSDIDLKSRSKISGIESEVISSHATDMATIIGGAGNSFYKGKGAAWGGEFASASFENVLPDDPAVFENLSISVQNHSYGFSMTDNQYGAEAEAYDVSANNDKELLHVFSSGNIGLNVTDHGVYEGVEGYANLSGNFKMAKNVLVLGAVDEFYEIDERNSVGPAYDGRVKPELVAFGKAGTSDAAAMVSGASGLLQQYYFNQQGVLPESALIKSILIAGADDVGSEGIDFITGYGNVNVFRAMKIIELGQYTSTLITKDNEVVTDLNIPANVSEVKVVISWNDPAANAGDADALVNDLDLTLEEVTSGSIWLPWVLDHSPDANLLGLPAIRKKDHLNNVEMITIDNPSNGAYRIKVDGNGLMTDEQQYHIAYALEYANSFGWDYPVAMDKVIGGEETLIRWSSNIVASSAVEITYDNGTSWATINATVNIAEGYLIWDVPEISTKAKLRVYVNGGYLESDEFIITPLVQVKVGFDCSDDFMLQWNKVDGIDNYNVYEVGNKYLSLIEQTSDTLYVFDKDIYSDINFAVSPVLIELNEGNTSLAFDYRQQGVNCYYRNFFAREIDNSYVEVELNLSSTYLVKEIIIERSADDIIYEFITMISADSPQLSYSYRDINPLIDFSYYRARIILEDDTEINDIGGVIVFFPNKNTLVVSPNPVEQGGFIDLETKGDGRLLELLDLQGKVLRQWVVDSNVTSYPLPNILKGMYIVRMRNSKYTFGVQRLMVY